MGKTYNKRSNNRPSSIMKKTRRARGGFINFMKDSMKKGTDAANTHYEKAKVDAFKQINDKKNKVATEAQGQMNKMKTTTIATANKVKYSSPTNFMLAKAAERTMKEAQPQLNQLKTDSSDFYNKSFGKQKALLAAKISDKGVPQSNTQFGGPNLIATSNPTMPPQ